MFIPVSAVVDRLTSFSSNVATPVARMIGITKIARKNPLPLYSPFSSIAINSARKIWKGTALAILLNASAR